jgi:nitroreductase
METLKTIALRKSIRSFKSEKISEDLLQKVVEAGSAAPVGTGAYQTIKITVIQNTAVIEKIRSQIEKSAGRGNYNPFYTPPALILVSCRREPTAHGREIADAACTIENMHLAATDLGLGSVFLWSCILLVAELPEIQKLLELPADFIPVAGLAIGYTAELLNTPKSDKKTIAVNFIK